MWRRLRYVAAAFEAAGNAHQTLATLDTIASDVGLRLYGIVPRHLIACGTDIGRQTLFCAVPARYRAQIMREYTRHTGPSAIRQYHDLHPAASFTLTEAMRGLRPSGEDRWVFDMLRDVGVRDGLHCTHLGTWGVLYSADHVLKGAETSDDIRMALGAASKMAITRLNELSLPRLPDAPAVPLSARELTMLKYRSEGFSVSEIAERLHLAERTVRTFLARASRKLDARNSTQAVAIAVRARLI